MKLTSMVLVAALAPATALAGPGTNNQDQTRQNDRTQSKDQNAQGTQGTPQESVQVEAFEWSTGQGKLGLMLMGLTPQLRSYFGAPNDNGLLVAQVAPNSPAARAGVKVGDVITKVDNQNVQGADDIAAATSSSTSNSVQIKVIRNHKTMNLQAMLGTKNQGQGT